MDEIKSAFWMTMGAPPKRWFAAGLFFLENEFLTKTN
jgi:hypothetical protein